MVILFEKDKLRYARMAFPIRIDSHQHNFEERAVFAGCSVRAVGTNETNTYQRTGRDNSIHWSVNQYSRTQPITFNMQKWYTMQSIVMSGKLPMRCAAKVPRVRCSAVYPTGRERIVNSRLEASMANLLY